MLGPMGKLRHLRSPSHNLTWIPGSWVPLLARAENAVKQVTSPYPTGFQQVPLSPLPPSAQDWVGSALGPAFSALGVC